MIRPHRRWRRYNPRTVKAKRVELGGIKFGSKGEAYRYADLQLAEKAGAIHSLTVHPRYELVPMPHQIVYVADFRYVQDQKLIVEDYKGSGGMTPEAALKIRLFQHLHPHIVFRLVY